MHDHLIWIDLRSSAFLPSLEDSHVRDSCGRMPPCRSTMAHKCVALALTFGELGDAARRGNLALRWRRFAYG